MQQRINWSNPANGQRLLAAILAAQGMKVRSLDLYILGSGLIDCLLPFFYFTCFHWFENALLQFVYCKRLLTTGREVFYLAFKMKTGSCTVLTDISVDCKEERILFSYPSILLFRFPPRWISVRFSLLFSSGQGFLLGHSTYWADITDQNFHYRWTISWLPQCSAVVCHVSLPQFSEEHVNN